MKTTHTLSTVYINKMTGKMIFKDDPEYKKIMSDKKRKATFEKNRKKRKRKAN